MCCRSQVQNVGFALKIVAAAMGGYPWPSLSSDRISATTRIPAWTHVGDSPAHACDLDAFPRLRIEVDSRDRSASD
jgi:hypothetical protein